MPTRFLYLADTHWGAEFDQGYTVQPRDPSMFEAIHQGLRQWLSQQNPPINFIVHGGDVVNNGSREQIIHAKDKLEELITPDRPMFVALGNHDLEQSDSMAHWRKYHPGLLSDDSGSYVVSFPEFHLYVLSHHWNSTAPPHYWDRDRGQTPLLGQQQRELFETFAANADRPIILVIHAPMQSVPPTQSGRDMELHVPDQAWRAYFLNAIDCFPAIHLVLSAHTHIHTLRHEKQCVVASTSAFFETPYEAKLITVSDHRIDLQTLRFGDILNLQGHYNPEKSFAQGQEKHRRANWPVRPWH